MAADLAARGVAFALVTVVRAVAPTSAKPGDKALLTERGEWLGWVGGSCAEPAARRAAQAALGDGACRLLQLTNEEPEGLRPGLEVQAMSCYSGGSLEIYVEPHLPRPLLVVCGASPSARALCELGAASRYDVIHLSGEGSKEGVAIAGVRSVGALGELPELRASTCVVIASHGRGEEDAICWALRSPAGYVGLVSSRRRWAEMRGRLAALGLSSEQIARVHAPAGLDMGAESPEEIALSVLSQIVLERRARGRDLLERAADSAPAAAWTESVSLAGEASRAVLAGSSRDAAEGTPSCCASETRAAPAQGAPRPRLEVPRVKSAGSCCDPVAEAPPEPPPSARAAGCRVSAVVLAAGSSRRMGAPNKLLLPAFGEPMIRRVVRTVLAAGAVEVVVVLGHEAEQVGAALDALDVRAVYNAAHETGQVSSVRAGLEALREPADAVMVCLGDQPWLTPEDLRALIDAFANRPRGSIVVPMCGDERGNPVILDARSVQETLARGVNFGCRHFMDEHAERVYAWPATSRSFVRDVDGPTEYEALSAQSQA